MLNPPPWRRGSSRLQNLEGAANKARDFVAPFDAKGTTTASAIAVRESRRARVLTGAVFSFGGRGPLRGVALASLSHAQEFGNLLEGCDGALTLG
jgi:hypothetical protein